MTNQRSFRLVWLIGLPWCVCSDTVTRYAENMLDLKRMLVTMILESMGVRKEHVDTFLESLNYSVRPSC